MVQEGNVVVVDGQTVKIPLPVVGLSQGVDFFLELGEDLGLLTLIIRDEGVESFIIEREDVVEVLVGLGKGEGYGLVETGVLEGCFLSHREELK